MPVTAGTTYVASYSHERGSLRDHPERPGSAVTNGPLTALANGGVYAYGSPATFPTSTYNGSNYWVDVVYQPNAGPNPPSVSATTPSNAATSVPVSAKVTVTFNKTIQPGSATFSLTGPTGPPSPGSTSLDSTGTMLTFTPSSPLSPGTTYTASVNGATSTPWGVAMTTPDTWTFTTSGPTACPCTIWESDAAPVNASANDSGAVRARRAVHGRHERLDLGRPVLQGRGKHRNPHGALWTSSGTLLAHGDVHQRDLERLADRWCSRTRCRSAPARRMWPRYYAPNGHYADDAGTSPARVRQLAAARPRRTGATGSSPTAATSSPRTPITARTTGSTRSSGPPSRRTLPPAVDTTDPVNGQTSVPTTRLLSSRSTRTCRASTIQFTLTGPGGVSGAWHPHLRFLDRHGHVHPVWVNARRHRGRCHPTPLHRHGVRRARHRW